ncbi:MAG TPA: enoyl-CoA hydratase/isomerase family protein, partial [Gammaproteobacteria bacterium]|nr:enoyl-CoA hydratase/isomerase family protein [Gammaproteobacteria bacterium]
RWLDANTALDWGLVNYVLPDGELHEQAFEYCLGLGRRSRGGLMTMKRLVNDGLEGSLQRGLDLEIHVAAEAMASADVNEGLAAFAEKREPQFD